MQSKGLQELMRKVKKEYVYWDKFRHYPIPDGFSPEEAWAFLKFSRMSTAQMTPVASESGRRFSFSLTNALYGKLTYIDKYTAGLLKSGLGRPTDAQKNQLIVSGLSEEAIASSQIEGASTSRKAAKEMILSERQPKTRDEQMILNNYKVMQNILDWKDLDMTADMLIDMQTTITRKAVDDESYVGRLRKDEDRIIVGDSREVVFVPPSEKFMKTEMDRFIRYANHDDNGENFVHPVIKAAILHFWLAYLHPFCDGNGRTARAVFYWYLIKNDYWLFQYLSVSRAIKQSRAQYDRAFLYSEYDEEDLTYFALFVVRSIEKSIEQFLEHYEKKVREAEAMRRIADRLEGFNPRQVALLKYLKGHKSETIDIATHQNKHGVAYQTARTDLLGLEERGLLAKMERGGKFVFAPNGGAIERLLVSA